MSALASVLAQAKEREEHHTPVVAGEDAPLVVYFSSVTRNTDRFVAKLPVRSLRLPLKTSDPVPRVTEPYVLAVPSYGRPGGAGSVPPQVVKFLNDAPSRQHLKGVLGAGNTNFGPLFCVAAEKVAAKCQVPLLYKFELMGTDEDVEKVTQGLEEFWQAFTQPRE
ncbi:class Ib ribonucleoside-diphosphate reductase assembly flavoprotein NrdI [Glutamicibacter protophormiae]|uniref:Protein NrdI n=1 Tax=Kocuria varians TaxID=1272 RepID=A0A7D7KZS5_KOCVA|nr:MULTISPECIES: class Ib ribonucleoside-diphosphate reductase assembly flavoprotein NrdI [Kocuria]MDN5631847.1 class Ib ribonucleoside-diphosphate reductase assembly flavoprotein NrdI [Kocuria sp.]QMS57245.1 Putative NrdI-like protein [Kocuria varians]WNB89606.1 class Ib ribonucleoside-diphosphate reductase assembly flavoprotein NrdI [Glutamicibacter protophormiae]